MGSPRSHHCKHNRDHKEQRRSEQQIIAIQ
jgi:hypothetical protein